MQYIDSSAQLRDYAIVRVEQLANVDVSGLSNGSVLVFNSEKNKWEVADNLSTILDGNNKTLRIKRGNGIPSPLNIGELYFDFLNNILYYGTSNGNISIGGVGEYVNRSTEQSISGNKTFLGSVEVQTPIHDKNPTTKLYVDTAVNRVNSMSALSDVDTSIISNGSVLIYDSQSSKWKSDQTFLNLNDGGNF